MSNSGFRQPFLDFAGFLQHLEESGNQLSTRDMQRIKNITEAIELLKSELRERFQRAITATVLSETPYNEDVIALFEQVVAEKYHSRKTEPEIIILALLEARLQSHEEFLSYDQIAARTGYARSGIPTCKTGIEYRCKAPFYLETQRKVGWRIGKREEN